jgi:hypothetical protein
MIDKVIAPMKQLRAVFALATLSLISFNAAAFAGAASHRPKAPKASKISIALSGPSSARRNESLEYLRFKAVLTNRSAEPLVLFVRDGLLMNARWDWSVTDAQGQQLGMEFVNRGFCGTPAVSPEAEAAAHRIHDTDLVTLAPGESREFAIPAGPSDDYNLPVAGTYHVAVMLFYLPPNATYFVDGAGHRQKAGGYDTWDLSQLSNEAAAALQRSSSLEAISNAWNLELPTARPHKNAVLYPPVALIKVPKL